MGRTLGDVSRIARRPYRVLEETLLHRRKYLLVGKVGLELVAGGMARIIESGMYLKWEAFFDAVSIPGRGNGSRGNTDFQAQLLFSNIGTVFFVLLVGCGCAFVLVAGEALRILEFDTIKQLPNVWRHYRWRKRGKTFSSCHHIVCKTLIKIKT